MLKTRSWVFLSSAAPSGSWKSKERGDLCPHPPRGALLPEQTHKLLRWLKEGKEEWRQLKLCWNSELTIHQEVWSFCHRSPWARNGITQPPRRCSYLKHTLFLILETLGMSNETVKCQPLNKKWMFTVSVRREGAAAHLSPGINEGSQPHHLFCINWCHTDVHDAAGGMLTPRPVKVVLYSMSCTHPARCRWK